MATFCSRAIILTKLVEVYISNNKAQYRLNGFRQYFFMFHIIKKAGEYDKEIPQSHSADQPTAYVKHVNPGRGNLWPNGHNLNKKGKYLLDNATQNIKAISLVVSDKKVFKVFELYFCTWDLDIPFDQLFERAI